MAGLKSYPMALGSSIFSQEPYCYMFFIYGWLTLVLELKAMVFAVVLVTLALSLSYTSSASAIGLVMLSVIAFGTGMANVVGIWARMETSLGAIARLTSFLEQTPAKEDLESSLSCPRAGHCVVESSSKAFVYDKSNSNIINTLLSRYGTSLLL